MSRIGKLPIQLIEGVSAKVNDVDIDIKGPKGELNVAIPPHVKVEEKDSSLVVSVKDEKAYSSYWGLGRSLINNAVIGVTEGYSKKLEINGVGYKVALNGSKLVLNVGYSHPIEFDAPEGIKLEVEGNTITISGIDKQLVGETSAKIRSFKKPEPYKGKGIKYSDEHVRRKAGKVLKGTEA